MAQFEIRRTQHPTPEAKRQQVLADPGFGKYYTDHMAVVNYQQDRGWFDPRIIPLQDFRMHPAAAVLHYGQEIFEGLKAYRRADDSVWLFRPEENAARLARSARRLEMAELPEELFLASVSELVALEQAWIAPGLNEESLYLRPFTIADEAYLGVRQASSYTYAVIASPAGPYYGSPVKLWITPNFTRAAKGGTGEAKCGGNYAASLAAATEAAQFGCDQVLYLDGAEHKWLEECGTMNFMAVTAEGELLTPALGSILAGITRKSILTLASDHGLQPVERPISIDELRQGLAEGKITETFACGTAAVITPIIGFAAPQSADVVVGDGTAGPKTLALREHLLDIQYGRAEDKHGWTQRVC